MANVLLIDDDPAVIPRQIRCAFPAPEHTVEVVRTAADGVNRVRAAPPDVVLLDLRLPDRPGLDVYREIRRIDGRIPVIFITGARSADAAIEAMQEGAFDYLFKPLDLVHVQQLVGAAVEAGRRMREPAGAAPDAAEPDAEGAIVGACPAMLEVYKAIGRVAAQTVPVLITGESGTGKELVALALHQHGPRARAPFLALNCAAIPEHLLESELFGHEKGAFTGADRRRVGKFEQCNGGTLFLDEVGDMPVNLQAKLLRVMQDQAFERVGGNETLRTDVRLIAATHRDLKAWAVDGRFRPDLYYRLGVFTIHLPPLRERGDDLLVLVRMFLRRFGRELSRDARDLDSEALARLRAYSWPGNVRELQSVLKQALLQTTGPVLPASALPPDLPRGAGPDRPERTPPFISGVTLEQLEREAIQHTLNQTGGNRQQAAQFLGISTRTLLRKIQQYGLKDPLHLESEVTDDRPASNSQSPARGLGGGPN